MKQVAILVLGLFIAGFSFDGQRKGFVLGGEVGPSYTTFNQTVTGFPASSQTGKMGLGTGFVIGYGFTNNFMLTYFSNTNWFSITNIYGNSVTISNGNAGVGAFYYFNDAPVFTPSPYLFGGLGWSGWSTPFEKNGTSSTGIGATGVVGCRMSVAEGGFT